ncbi:hypothetical protein C8Q72DRAFT_793023 [Fomitopsis betulina]|nr:hypothetical protein C8Q72DRAFT_793023 [Fomitopsis betulina]
MSQCIENHELIVNCKKCTGVLFHRFELAREDELEQLIDGDAEVDNQPKHRIPEQFEQALLENHRYIPSAISREKDYISVHWDDALDSPVQHEVTPERCLQLAWNVDLKSHKFRAKGQVVPSLHLRDQGPWFQALSSKPLLRRWPGTGPEKGLAPNLSVSSSVVWCRLGWEAIRASSFSDTAFQKEQARAFERATVECPT